MRPIAHDVAWIAPGNLHLTLKFLGAVPEERIEAIVAALGRSGSDLRPFEARIHGLGAFPSVTRPRVIWAGVLDGAPEMMELARRVDTALAALGFAREERPFSPHVTLGRVRRPGRDPTLSEALTGGSARQFGRMRVPGACLMRSELGPRGARYTELAAVPLGGPV